MKRAKFRVFAPDGEFWYWGFTHEHCGGFSGLTSSTHWSMTLEQIEAASEQCTGLVDSQGREIWEGDIVQRHVNLNKGLIIGRDEWGNDVMAEPDYLAFVGIVRYSAKGYYLKCHVDGGIDGLMIERATLANSKKFSTVMGNIHQNPELLEVSG
jgi:uncharacterized phage protein (TIGR01671 family)